MRFELELVRPSVAPDPKAPSAPSRKALREVTDRIICGALAANDLPGLVEASCGTMLAVAAILVGYEQCPQVPDFVEAAQASIETARAVMDKGLMLQSWETVNCGAVMLEITVRGICAALSVPYDKVLTECHRAQLAGDKPAVRMVLTEAGLIAQEDHSGAAG